MHLGKGESFMESNLLKLSPDEAVVKKYDFSTHVDADEEDFGKEDSLTFTNKRIVRRTELIL